MRALAFVLLALLAGCADAHPRDTALRIDMQQGVCSATAVGRNLILTATHCLANGNRVVSINGEPAHALERVDDGNDHTLLRVSMTFRRWAAVAPGFRPESRVFWTGTPGGNSRVYREGYVARVMPDQVWLDAQAFGGDSGGGVFDQSGRLVGVVSGSYVMQRGALRMQFTVALPLKFNAKDWLEIRA